MSTCKIYDENVSYEVPTTGASMIMEFARHLSAIETEGDSVPLNLSGGKMIVEHEIANPAAIVDLYSPQVIEYLTITYSMQIYAHPRPAAILIIPSEKEINNIVEKIRETCAKEKVLPSSAEGRELIIKGNLGEFDYKKYCLDVFGNTSDQGDHPYRFDESEPKRICRRTTRASTVLWVQLDKDFMLISRSAKMENASKYEILAKAKGNVYVVGNADYPANGDSTNATEVKKMTGGGRRKMKLHEHFINMAEEYPDMPLDDVADRFAANVVSNFAYSNNISVKESAKQMMKYYSGDAISTAFKMTMDEDNISIDASQFRAFPESALNYVRKEILDAYTIADATQFQNPIQSVRRLHGSSHSTPSEKLEKVRTGMYGKVPRATLEADIATSIAKVMADDNSDIISNSEIIKSAIVSAQNMDSNPELIMDAFSRYPIAGFIGRSEAPRQPIGSISPATFARKAIYDEEVIDLASTMQSSVNTEAVNDTTDEIDIEEFA